MENINVSIIIVNYNTFWLTCNCIKSIIEKTHDINYEIVLIDNASTECDSGKFKTLFPSITLIKNKYNLGFAEANNIGIKQSKANVVLLLNSDTIVNECCIEKCYFHLVNKCLTSEIVLSCQLLNQDGSIQTNCFFENSIPSLKATLKENPIIYYLFGDFLQQKNKDIQALSGAFFMFKKDFIKSQEYFDEDFFLYFEEIEWCQRLYRSGFRFMLYSEVSTMHLGSQSSVNTSTSKQNMGSKCLCILKCYGKLIYVAYLFLYCFNFISIILILPFANKNNKKTYLENISLGVVPFKIPFLFKSGFSKSKRKLNLMTEAI